MLILLPSLPPIPQRDNLSFIQKKLKSGWHLPIPQKDFNLSFIQKKLKLGCHPPIQQRDNLSFIQKKLKPEWQSDTVREDWFWIWNAEYILLSIYCLNSIFYTSTNRVKDNRIHVNLSSTLAAIPMFISRDPSATWQKIKTPSSPWTCYFIICICLFFSLFVFAMFISHFQPHGRNIATGEMSQAITSFTI